MLYSNSRNKKQDLTLKLIEENDKKLKTFKACLRAKNHTFIKTYLFPFLVYELLLKTKQYIAHIIAEIRDVIEYEYILQSQQTQLCIHPIFYLMDVLMSWYYKIPFDFGIFDKINKDNTQLKLYAIKQM